MRVLGLNLSIAIAMRDWYFDSEIPPTELAWTWQESSWR